MTSGLGEEACALLVLARERRGWARHDLAHKLRCSSFWITEIETDLGIPSALTFDVWLDALDVQGDERALLEKARIAARAA
jgi:ribosome-binding protein aMBF1 (putative translation factor)